MFIFADDNKVSSEWTTVNGVNGRRVTDIATGASIFLPAAGYRQYNTGALHNNGSGGHYWMSKQIDLPAVTGLDVSCLSGLDFDDFYCGAIIWLDHSGRSTGLSIRCVAE